MDKLIQHLRDVGVLKEPNIIAAFGAIDRKDFVLPEYRDAAYEDYPLPISSGQTISQPYTVAFMLELLQPKSGEKILDVGSGSGWTTALLAHIVGSKGHVYGTEIIPELVAFGQRNLAKYRLPQARIVQAHKKLGMPKKAPFDKILASATASSLPKELVQQLKIGGILVIPVREDILRVRKISETKTDIQKFPGFTFVPLIE
ncbi:MAG: protein-L-isoaspartate O-methyltransferase [Candidatus Wildermuthbacteria bacterium]|nr:protein-L-isoaspartate O-methyltransferase [Candidatus Wildermuthbacteria bacterium]